MVPEIQYGRQILIQVIRWQSLNLNCHN
jgi:hypothetical protein